MCLFVGFPNQAYDHSVSKWCQIFLLASISNILYPILPQINKRKLNAVRVHVMNNNDNPVEVFNLSGNKIVRDEKCSSTFKLFRLLCWENSAFRPLMDGFYKEVLYNCICFSRNGLFIRLLWRIIVWKLGPILRCQWQNLHFHFRSISDASSDAMPLVNFQLIQEIGQPFTRYDTTVAFLEITSASEIRDCNS